MSRCAKSYLLLARNLVLLGAKFRSVAHEVFVVNVPQTVLNNSVNKFLVSVAASKARFGNIIRRVAHALHAACDNNLRASATAFVASRTSF